MTISYAEVYHLAWLNWRKDGCPQGQDMEYWLAAEEMLIDSHQTLIAAGRIIPRSERAVKSNRPSCTVRSRSRRASLPREKAGKLPVIRLIAEASQPDKPKTA